MWHAVSTVQCYPALIKRFSVVILSSNNEQHSPAALQQRSHLPRFPFSTGVGFSARYLVVFIFLHKSDRFFQWTMVFSLGSNKAARAPIVHPIVSFISPFETDTRVTAYRKGNVRPSKKTKKHATKWTNSRTSCFVPCNWHTTPPRCTKTGSQCRYRPQLWCLRLCSLLLLSILLVSNSTPLHTTTHCARISLLIVT